MADDHPITVTPTTKQVTVTWAGRPLADTTKALVLQEASYPPVYYLPRADVEMTLLESSSHTTRCPYKGDATYFTLSAGDQRAENAVWSYEHPLPAVAAIADHLAFYPNKVEIHVAD